MKTNIIATLTLATFAFAGCSKAAPVAQAPAPAAVATASTHAADAAHDAASHNMETKAKAVLIFAEWCGSCKALDPKVEQVKAFGPIPGLEHVVLDFTAKDNAAFFAQADAAGVGQAVRGHFGDKVKTGQLLLIDLDDQAVLSSVTKTFEVVDITKALTEAVKAS